LCQVYLSAKDDGILTVRQLPLATASEILIRNFAKVGIIALIDEATGYQAQRDREELQKLLAAYINEEFLPWTKRFPDSFYVEMFRLRGWEYKGKPKPPLVGKITNELVYDKLPEKVIEEIKKQDPNRKHRIHQYLTIDTGVPHLDRHLASVITLMRVSDNWEQFEELFNKAFPVNDIKMESESKIEG
jgi:hypothetical protein